MVHSGYHPHPLRLVLGTQCHPLKHCPLRLGYHPLKHCPLRLVLGWCTVDIILLNIVLLG